MIRVLFLPKNAAASGSSLGEKELDAYDGGVRGRFDEAPGDFFSLSKAGWKMESSASMRAATVADHLGESSPSGVLGGTTQHRSRQLLRGL